MRNKIFGTIGIVIGLLSLATAWRMNQEFGSDTFESLQKISLIMGCVFLVASIYTLFKKTNKPKN